MSPAILCASEPGLWDQVLAVQEAMKFFLWLLVHSHTQQSCALCINVVTSGTVPLLLPYTHAGPLKIKAGMGKTAEVASFLRRIVS